MVKKQKPVYYGGQAVIEGVMMKGPRQYAVVCRKPDGELVTMKKPVDTIKNKYPILKAPVVRGVVNFIEQFALGMKLISWSANQAGEEEEELGGGAMALSITIALVLVIAFFFVLPVWLGTIAHSYIGDFGRSLLEGIIRIALFVLYIVAIRRMQEIKRLFQYHGAEHKTINALESGEELTPANAARHSLIHYRCGTSFLLMTMIIMIIIFTFVGQTEHAWGRVVIKLCLAPLVAGITYEFIFWAAGHYRYRVVRILIAPGMWLQRLTTAEPNHEQLAVAIAALKDVLPSLAPLTEVVGDHARQVAGEASIPATAPAVPATVDDHLKRCNE